LRGNIAPRESCVKRERHAPRAKSTISLSEAAEHFEVDRKTILRWWNRGYLRVEMQILPGGQRRFERAAFLAAAARVPKTMRPPVPPGETLRTEALRIAERWERRSGEKHGRNVASDQNKRGQGFAEPAPRGGSVENAIIGPATSEVKEVTSEWNLSVVR
jgi:hypothetical protein